MSLSAPTSTSPHEGWGLCRPDYYLRVHDIMVTAERYVDEEVKADPSGLEAKVSLDPARSAGYLLVGPSDQGALSSLRDFANEYVTRETG